MDAKLQKYSNEIKLLLPELTLFDWRNKTKTGTNDKVLVVCSIHGKGWEWPTPWTPKLSHVTQGHGCPKCGGNYRPTKQEVIDSCNSIKDSNLTLIDIPEYKGHKSKCHVKCRHHGNGWTWERPWLPSVESLKNKTECPKCTNKYKPTEQEAIVLVKTRMPSNLTLHEFVDFVGVDKSACRISCSVHGKTWEWSSPWLPKGGHFLKPLNCPKCSGVYRRSKQEIITDYISPNLSIVDIPNYKNTRSKCHVFCKVHGEGWKFDTPWLPSVSKLFSGTNCPKCSNVYRYSKRELMALVAEWLSGTNLSIVNIPHLSGYDSKCHIHCQIHGNSWEWSNPWLPSASNFRVVRNCPKCAKQYNRTKSEMIELVQNSVAKTIKIVDIPNYKGVESRCHVSCTIHGEGWKWANAWTPKVTNLITGYGCPKCDHATNNLKQIMRNRAVQNLPSTLYYIEFNDIKQNQPFWKIGICDHKGVNGRYRKGRLRQDNVRIVNIKEVITTKLKAALAEYYVLLNYQEFSIGELNKLKESKGSTECFSEDILKDSTLKDIIELAYSKKDNLLNRLNIDLITPS